jgi:hypothetical protein
MLSVKRGRLGKPAQLCVAQLAAAASRPVRFADPSGGNWGRAGSDLHKGDAVKLSKSEFFHGFAIFISLGMVGLGVSVMVGQAPQFNPQAGPQLNPYTQMKNIPVQSLVFFWQVAQTMPPACNSNLPSGTPGPPLYSFAVVQSPGAGTGDKLYIAMIGSSGLCEWVPWLTAP